MYSHYIAANLGANNYLLLAQLYYRNPYPKCKYFQPKPKPGLNKNQPKYQTKTRPQSTNKKPHSLIQSLIHFLFSKIFQPQFFFFAERQGKPPVTFLRGDFFFNNQV